MCLVYYADTVPGMFMVFISAPSLYISNSLCFCFTGKRKRASSLTANKRTKFSHLQKMALEALYKDSKYPSHGVIEEFAKLNNLDGATVKVWFNNKRQRDTGEPSDP